MQKEEEICSAICNTCKEKINLINTSFMYDQLIVRKKHLSGMETMEQPLTIKRRRRKKNIQIHARSHEVMDFFQGQMKEEMT